MRLDGGTVTLRIVGKVKGGRTEVTVHRSMDPALAKDALRIAKTADWFVSGEIVESK